MAQFEANMVPESGWGGSSAAVSGRKIVLVVEDDVLLRLAISETLREAGYFVLEAATSESAMVLLASYDVALLFTDIKLDGVLDGTALARVARRHRPDVIVIATSGMEEPTGLDPDVTFVPKPYQPEMIVDLMNDRLN